MDKRYWPNSLSDVSGPLAHWLAMTEFATAHDGAISSEKLPVAMHFAFAIATLGFEIAIVIKLHEFTRAFGIAGIDQLNSGLDDLFDQSDWRQLV